MINFMRLVKYYLHVGLRFPLIRKGLFLDAGDFREYNPVRVENGSIKVAGKVFLLESAPYVPLNDGTFSNRYESVLNVGISMRMPVSHYGQLEGETIYIRPLINNSFVLVSLSEGSHLNKVVPDDYIGMYEFALYERSYFYSNILAIV